MPSTRDGLTVTVPVEDGEDYAIVPIMLQVEVPRQQQHHRVILPEDVTVLALDSPGPADHGGGPRQCAERGLCGDLPPP